MDGPGKAVRSPVSGPGSPQTSGLPPQPHPGASDEQREDQGTSSGVRPERQPESYGLSDEAARVTNPMYASNPGTTPMQQPQTLRYYAAARIPNPTFASNAGTQQPLPHWRSLANATTKMFNPMYAFSSDVPPIDQPQTDYQARENDAVNTPEVTYASLPDDPPMDQPQTDHQAHGAYPGGASSRRGVCSFLYARRSCMAATIAVLLSLVAVGLTPLTFSNKQEISHLSTTVKLDQDKIRQLSATLNVLKRDQDTLRRLSTTVDALKRDQDGMSATVDALKRDQVGMSTTFDALKRDQDTLRRLSTTVDALKRDQDTLRRLSTTVDALKRDQDGMYATVDALKRDQVGMSTTFDALKRDQDTLRRLSATVDALKQDQDGMSSTVDAVKRDQDDVRRLPTTVDALKCDQDNMSATVDALKRDQDGMSATVDAVKRDQDGMSATADASKRDLDIERSQTATSEKRLHERTLCKSFSEAAAACRADGGTLAMPRDAETNAFLISLYKSLNIDDHFWFGLHDQREEGRFEWVDGSALGSYSSWGPEQPDNYIYRSYGDQDCVAYHGHPTASPKDKDKWFDQPCGFWKNFICQAAPGTCRIRSIS
ncbi:hypothetical protein Bbelb_199560 [Branchiostoma belcheri]|nr:hypothetical protein Bbelb_199560 [Branchiostoma belcheri]